MAEKKTETKNEKLLEVKISANHKDEFLEFLKKKEAEKVPETILEMTPEEHKDYLEFVAKKEADAANEGFSEMYLNFAHHVNNKKYGPGKATIPNGILGTIAWTDHQRTTQEMTLNTSNKRLVEILQNGQQVPRKAS